MKRMFAAAAVLAFYSSAVLADDKPTDDEAAKIKAAVAAWGCEGGT